MANFDPVPLLTDPDFKTPFTIRRYVQSRNNYGETTVTPTNVEGVGVVVPSGSLGMVRTAEVERQGDNITIYSLTPISTGDAAAGTPADDVVFHNQVYQVISQDDYSDFGYYVAEARLQEPGGRLAS